MLSRSAPEAVFSSVAEATLRGLQLTLDYTSRSREETRNRTLSPQRLLHYRSNWYLLAWCHDADDLRLFSLDRMQHPTVTSETATECAPESIDARHNASFGIFTGEPTQSGHLRFSPQAARWAAEETWHPRQKGEWNADGFYHLHVPYSDSTELVMEVLRYGPEVEVLEPNSLRQTIADKISQTYKIYW